MVSIGNKEDLLKGISHPSKICEGRYSTRQVNFFYAITSSAIPYFINKMDYLVLYIDSNMVLEATLFEIGLT